MNVFDAARADLAGKLDTGAPFPVTLDPAANVPMILVDLVTVAGAAGVGGWKASIAVRVIVPPPGDAGALSALGDGLEWVLRTLGGAPAAAGVLPVGAANCPAYTVTYPVDIPNPDC